MRLLLLVLTMVAASVLPGFSLPAAAQGFTTKAKQAYMVEASTGTVLLAESENQAFATGSLSKLMTMEVVFNALKRGEIALDTSFHVSENAWRRGGAPSRTTTMFAALKSQISVGDLIRGVVVHNANDGCIVIAEGMSRTEEAFAARMTARARDIGLTRSVFGNATGLPGAESLSTAHDLVLLAQHLHREYPQFMPLYAQPDFEWNRITQRNKNPLLGLGIGIEGFGAGFAEGFGYGFVATVERNGTRLFVAMSGLASEKERLDEARRVIEWGLSAFEMRVLFAKGEVIGQASVYGGRQQKVDLVAEDSVSVYVPSDNAERISGRIVYDWPLHAPVESGRDIGALRLYLGDRLLREVPLASAGAVSRGDLASRSLDALMELLFFWL